MLPDFRHQLLCSLRLQECRTAIYHTDRVYQLFGASFFEEVIHCPSFDSLENLIIARVVLQDQDEDDWLQIRDLLNGRNAIFDRHLEPMMIPPSFNPGPNEQPEVSLVFLLLFVGHDWGAVVAWAFAIWHPERLRKLGILNVPHPAVMLNFLRRGDPEQLRRSWYIFFFQLPWLPEYLLRKNVWRRIAFALHCTTMARSIPEQTKTLQNINKPGLNLAR